MLPYRPTLIFVKVRKQKRKQIDRNTKKQAGYHHIAQENAQFVMRNSRYTKRLK